MYKYTVTRLIVIIILSILINQTLFNIFLYIFAEKIIFICNNEEMFPTFNIGAAKIMGKIPQSVHGNLLYSPPYTSAGISVQDYCTAVKLSHSCCAILCPAIQFGTTFSHQLIILYICFSVAILVLNVVLSVIHCTLNYHFNLCTSSVSCTLIC